MPMLPTAWSLTLIAVAARPVPEAVVLVAAMAPSMPQPCLTPSLGQTRLNASSARCG